MNRYGINFKGKDLCTRPQETARLTFASERGRDEYWTAFWRVEVGFKPMFWTAERTGPGTKKPIKRA